MHLNQIVILVTLISLNHRNNNLKLLKRSPAYLYLAVTDLQLKDRISTHGIKCQSWNQIKCKILLKRHNKPPIIPYIYSWLFYILRSDEREKKKPYTTSLRKILYQTHDSNPSRSQREIEVVKRRIIQGKFTQKNNAKENNINWYNYKTCEIIHWINAYSNFFPLIIINN